MLYLRGGPALSAFRLDKLLAAARERVPAVSAVHAEYVYFADTEQRLDELNDRTDVCRRVRALIDALKAEMGGGAEMTPTPRLAVNPPADQAREAYLAATRDLVASPSTSREDADRRHELRRAAGVSGDEDAQICRDLEREVRGR